MFTFEWKANHQPVKPQTNEPAARNPILASFKGFYKQGRKKSQALTIVGPGPWRVGQDSGRAGNSMLC